MSVTVGQRPAILFSSDKADEITAAAYGKNDVDLVEVMLLALDHAHWLAEQADNNGLHNTITVAECTFEAIIARWIPPDAFVEAYHRAYPELVSATQPPLTVLRGGRDAYPDDDRGRLRAPPPRLRDVGETSLKGGQ